MKIKALMPSLREKKRYLAFEVMTDGSKGYTDVLQAIRSGLGRYLGIIGSSRAGIRMMNEMYDPRSGRGLIRVSHRYLEAARAGLTLITDIGGHPAMVRSVGASGILKKAKTNYLEV